MTPILFCLGFSIIFKGRERHPQGNKDVTLTGSPLKFLQHPGLGKDEHRSPGLLMRVARIQLLEPLPPSSQSLHLYEAGVRVELELQPRHSDMLTKTSENLNHYSKYPLFLLLEHMEQL